VKRWIWLGGCLWLGFFARLWINGACFRDEAWFLHITLRHLEGEVLYRDVFLGVTPLSVQVASAWLRLWGESWLALKALSALIAAGTLLLTLFWGRQKGFSRNELLFFGAILWMLTPLEGHSLYAPLGAFLLLVGFYLVDREAPSWLGGLALGLTAATKQTIGLAGLAAAGWAIAHRSDATGKRKTAQGFGLLGGFLLGNGLALLPFLGTGAFPHLWVQGFVGKSRYLRVSLAPFRGDEWPGALNLCFMACICAILLLPLMRRKQDAWPQDSLKTLYPFALLSMVAVAVRAVWGQVYEVLPLVGLVALASWRMVSEAISARVWKGLLIGLTGGSILIFVKPLLKDSLSLLRGQSIFVHSGPFHGLPMRRDPGADLLRGMQMLGTGRTDTFLLMKHAAHGYRLGGARNPTPYDYPTVPAFSRDGEAHVLEAIRCGRVQRVLIWRDHPATRNRFLAFWLGNLRAGCRTEMLESWIQANMTYQGSMGSFEVYTR